MWTRSSCAKGAITAVRFCSLRSRTVAMATGDQGRAASTT
jgi:hypothetical protein